MGVSGIFLKATGNQILAFQCDREFIDDGVRVCMGPWRGFKFSEDLKIEEYSFTYLTNTVHGVGFS